MPDEPSPETGSSLGDKVSSLRNEVEGLRLLLEISRRISTILDPDELLEGILDSAIQLTGASRALLLSLEEEDLRVLLGRGSGLVSLDPRTAELSRTLARECLEKNRAVAHDRLRDHPEFRAVESIHALELYSAVCVPLLDRGRAKGVLYLDSQRPGLRTSARELELLEAFAAQATVSLGNAGLVKEAEESRILLERENRGLRMQVRAASGLGEIIGRSRPMQVIFEQIRQLKDSPIPVLILGESGTGKELVARALHYEGIRREGPFVPVNCAGIPGDLLDSLMFGHRRGAFTGAVSDSPGFVEQSQDGSLFLDEIGDMPAALQVKILRFLAGGEFRRVGEVELRRVQTRVISATNQDLSTMMMRKTFREDLYYRLAGVTLRLPPLRERRDDIPLLVEAFLARIHDSQGRPPAGLSPRAHAFLLDHPWPGNVRQLQRTLEGACALVPADALIEEEHLQMLLPRADGTADGAVEGAAASSGGPGLARGRGPEGVPPAGPQADPLPPRPKHGSAGEREWLLALLSRHDWNVTRAAETGGITRQHLYNKMRAYGLKRPEP